MQTCKSPKRKAMPPFYLSPSSASVNDYGRRVGWYYFMVRDRVPLPIGPFATEAEALADAQSSAGEE